LVDVVGTIALLTKDPTKPGVSVELNTTFVRAAKAGETVVVTGRYSFLLIPFLFLLTGLPVF
jgi:acyl-coenzyme A thioesterase 13